MVNAQEYLEKYIEEVYNSKDEAKEIDLSFLGLEGDLELSEYPNLEVLNCPFNYLNNINLINNKKIKTVIFDSDTKEVEILKEELAQIKEKIDINIKELKKIGPLDEKQVELLLKYVRINTELARYKREQVGSSDWGGKICEYEKNIEKAKEDLKESLGDNDNNKMRKISVIKNCYEKLQSIEYLMYEKGKSQPLLTLPKTFESMTLKRVAPVASKNGVELFSFGGKKKAIIDFYQLTVETHDEDTAKSIMK